MDTAKILRELLGGNATNSRRVREMQQQGGGGNERMGSVLEDLLGVTDDDERPRSRPRPRVQEQPRRREVRVEREPELAPRKRSGGLLDDLLGGLLGGGKRAQPAERAPERAPEPRRRSREDQSQAVFLIRAMCNAAKVDGDIDRSEQDAILGRLGEVTQEELDFVRKELASPLNVKLFCRSVPEEMADQVYGFSVMAIQLDTLKEAAYLGSLAQGLDLDPSICNRLHEKVGAPTLFS